MCSHSSLSAQLVSPAPCWLHQALLNQYLSSKINEDLHVPPTHTIRLDGSSFHGG